MELFDLRAAGFNTAPALRFGHRYHDGEGTQREIRYVRGSAKDVHFARGYKDGTVKMWDIRMARQVRFDLLSLGWVLIFRCAGEEVCGRGRALDRGRVTGCPCRVPR
jgi:hypothetical protein